MKPLCVVLNNQYQSIIDEFTLRCGSDPSIRVVFQPYTPNRLRQVYDLVNSSSTPIPLFLMAGNYGDAATACGNLHAVQYRENLTRVDKASVQELISDTDEGVYATNLLFASAVKPLARPMPVSRFQKRSGGALKSGRWPAVVCYSPTRWRKELPLPEAALDESVSAVEGTERARMVNHRRREWRLREAKINQTLKTTGALRCEVPGCGFDFRRTYGELGARYAQVHHLSPLSSGAKVQTSLRRLVVVCANCHAMIHRAGACRGVDTIGSAIAKARS